MCHPETTPAGADYLLACVVVNLNEIPDRPGSGCEASRATGLGCNPRLRDSSSLAVLHDERHHAHPLGHRVRRPQGKRATPALGLPGAAHTGRPEIVEGEAWPDTPGDRLG